MLLSPEYPSIPHLLLSPEYPSIPPLCCASRQRQVRRLTEALMTVAHAEISPLKCQTRQSSTFTGTRILLASSPASTIVVNQLIWRESSSGCQLINLYRPVATVYRPAQRKVPDRRTGTGSLFCSRRSRTGTTEEFPPSWQAQRRVSF